MLKILEVHTEHSGPFKTLIEVLKDMLPEVNMEFRLENKNKDNENLNDSSENENDEDNDNDDENNENDNNKKNIDKSGIKILAVDTTKTVLIHMKLEAKNFPIFKCTSEGYKIGVNLVFFHKLIKSMDKDDTLTLCIEHDDVNYLNIKIDNPGKNRKDTMKLKLLDLDDEIIDLPDITFDAVVTIKGTEFHKICREMSNFADFVEIQCLEKKIIFSCKGDYAERTTTFTTDDESGDSVDIKHAKSDGVKKPIIQGIYELKNLVLFGKCSNLCGAIQIYMKNNYPLVIRYTISHLGRILLCLTPINSGTAKNNNYEEENNYYSDDEVEFINNE